MDAGLDTVLIYASNKSYKSYWNSAWPIRGSSNGLIQLPQTGQHQCWDTSGNVISCAGTGQDGDVQIGVSSITPRFTDNLNGTIKDNLTGLQWTKDANLMVSRDPSYDDVDLGYGTSNDGAVTWQHALDYVKKLNQENYGGYNDWRLPNYYELLSLANYGESDLKVWLSAQGFSNIADGAYLTSNSNFPGSYPEYAYSVEIYIWTGWLNKKDSEPGFVWPVRTGQ